MDEPTTDLPDATEPDDVVVPDPADRNGDGHVSQVEAAKKLLGMI